MTPKLHRQVHTILSPVHALRGILVEQLRLDSKLGYQISVQLAQSRLATDCTWPWEHDLALRPSEVFQFVRLGAWNPLRFFLIFQESHRLFIVAQEWEQGLVMLKAVTVTTESVPANWTSELVVEHWRIGYSQSVPSPGSFFLQVPGSGLSKCGHTKDCMEAHLCWRCHSRTWGFTARKVCLCEKIIEFGQKCGEH